VRGYATNPAGLFGPLTLDCRHDHDNAQINLLFSFSTFLYISRNVWKFSLRDE